MMYMGLRMEYRHIKKHGYVLEGVARAEFARVEDYVLKLNNAASSGAGTAAADALSNAFQTDDVKGRSRWNFMHNQAVYRSAATQGAVAGLVLAFLVILTATAQPVLAAAATLSIGGTMVTVIGAMYLLGWEVGVFEAILITVTSGFAVDYVVHLAHAYNHVDPTAAAAAAGEVR
jgi:predicted RND superfamily exporter protein